MPTVFIAVTTVYGVVSLMAFVAFGLDKRAARLCRRRTPERRLHLLSLLGGWPGAFAAMGFFKHKRRKPPFVRRVWAITVLHGFGWTVAGYFLWWA